MLYKKELLLEEKCIDLNFIRNHLPNEILLQSFVFCLTIILAVSFSAAFASMNIASHSSPEITNDQTEAESSVAK